MSIISTKGAYGLTAMVILFREEKQELLQIKDIAVQGDIPRNYLEQILVMLKKSGLVESVRGANGGYKLSKEPTSITVYEILDALECCLLETDNRNSILQPFWEETQKKMAAVFSLTLNELEDFLQNKNKNIIYHI